MKKLILSLSLAVFLIFGVAGVQNVIAETSGIEIVNLDKNPKKDGDKNKKSADDKTKATAEKADCSKEMSSKCCDKASVKDCSSKKTAMNEKSDNKDKDKK